MWNCKLGPASVALSLGAVVRMELQPPATWMAGAESAALHALGTARATHLDASKIASSLALLGYSPGKALEAMLKHRAKEAGLRYL